MIDRSVIARGDVLRDLENGHLYVVVNIHGARDEVRVVRRTPRNDCRRRHPAGSGSPGHYKSCSRFEEAICPELLEEL